MKVILKKDIKGTGKAGDLVEVSDGYARNFLIPKNDAIEATKSNVQKLKMDKANEAAMEKERKEKAEKTAEFLKTCQVKIETKAGEGGKLFGSITSKDIATALKKQHDIAVDKKKIKIDQQIKNVGTFHVEIKLYHNVSAEVEVKVEG